MADYSVVCFSPDHSGYSCGYCKSPDTNYSNGLWAHTLTVHDYQDLIDRGWRRSGQYCYKPIMDITCCPLYTIKCEALDFKLSKSQKKLLKRMHKFLAEGLSCKEVKGETNGSHPGVGSETGGFVNDVAILHEKAMNAAQNAGDIIIKQFDRPSGSGEISAHVTPEKCELPEECDKKEHSQSGVHETSLSGQHTELNNLKTPRSGIGRDFTKPLCKKAKIIRLERKQKLAEKETATDSNIKRQANEEKSLEQFLNEPFFSKPAHSLELRLVSSSPMCDEFRQSFNAELELYQKYQVSVHQDPPEKCTKQQFTRFLVKSPLMVLKCLLVKTKQKKEHSLFVEQVRLVGSRSDDNDLEASWRLYVKYQTTIHKESEEECSFSSFVNFLVETPFQQYKPKSGPSCGYGSFHQQYWLDDKLIAVGVIDILPKCLSSVYFFYDPEYSHLTLGTYGSLREMAFVRSLAKEVPTIRHYYMGFYIHSCPKMRYKARMNPSFLLCPEVYSWHPIENCVPKLEVNKYSRLNDDIDAICKDSEVDINKVMVLWNCVVMHYNKFKAKSDYAKDEFVLQYASLVGNKCAERMLLFMQ